ncbi:MAG: radical SAM protein, partial [Alphaproteobacteria bacterium]|nr:radical SAM protein [Alphaproteobacteria bacterium]
MPDIAAARARQFRLVMIKPSHYDDDGYVIQWVRSAIPSNTLAVLNGLALDCVRREVLGTDVEITITAYDETNARIKPARLIAQMRAAGMSGLVAFVGVQSNQFPHTMDIARVLRAAGVQVSIGGFHASGCLAMLPELPPDLQEALDLGISIYAGEAEGRLDEVLIDAYHHRLKPIYNYMNDLPGLEGAVTPLLPSERIKRVAGGHTSFDSGRGCPFQCTFCTIINVQGRKSRYRDGADIERIIRENVAQGIHSFFITDDNFARNKNWEQILDRLIDLREREGIAMKFIIQVDTLCHRLPNFIEKCRRAGVKRVFIGLESINPDNLMAVGKKQNRVGEYRTMLQSWKAAKVVTYCGYIVGLPNDTPESVARDVKTIQRELPIDLVEFNVLTPLP